ncbi:single-stranded DNA-binding protein [Amedibacillus sp. YH-ame6]
MINRVVLIGRLTKDPVLRKTSAGASVTSFTLACDRKIKVEGQPTADFINNISWNKTADIIAKYAHKGALIGVEGRIQTRSYDGSDGKKVFITEVVAESVQFLDTKSSAQSDENNGMNENTFNQETSDTGYGNASSSSTFEISSDDLPF